MYYVQLTVAVSVFDIPGNNQKYACSLYSPRSHTLKLPFHLLLNLHLLTSDASVFIIDCKWAVRKWWGSLGPLMPSLWSAVSRNMCWGWVIKASVVSAILINGRLFILICPIHAYYRQWSFCEVVVSAEIDHGIAVITWKTQALKQLDPLERPSNKTVTKFRPE